MIGLLLAAALVLQAQPASPAAENDVVVTGVRDRTEAVRDFVGALTVANADRQLSRFDARQVCPAAMGLTPSQKAAVVARMRQIAGAARIPLAGPKCRSNVLVIVTNDRKALLERLAKERRLYFPGMSGREVRALIDQPGAAVAWQVAGPALTADGFEMPVDPDTGTAVNQTTARGSRLTVAARPQFAAAAVVIDAAALNGLTTTQLADYAAMRSFARIDPARLAGTPTPTILTALDAAPDALVPVTMTDWDLELLRALYASDPKVTAPSQREAIARKIEKRLEGQR